MILFPNAKINLGLNVVSKRADGYHNLETIFYPIPIYDALEVLISPNLASRYEFTSSGIEMDCSVEKNLCIKAYNLLAKDFELQPVLIHLHKHIPMGGGLGGGSADATFMLVALNTLFSLDISDDKLINYAVQLGADCPFFVKNKACFASGIGEVLEPINLSLKGYYLVLANPNIHISTAEAFSNISPKAPVVSILEHIAKPQVEWKNLLKNDFEESVFPAHPEIKIMKERFYADGALYVSMSGSGSSVYAIFDAKPESISLSDYIIWQGALE